MKKSILITMLAAAMMAACGNGKGNQNGNETQNESGSVAISEDNLVGDWTMTAYGDSATVMGVRLSAGGKAESINMPTMPYEHWEMGIDPQTIVITGKSIMDDQQADVSDTMLVDVKAGTMANRAIPEIIYKKERVSHDIRSQN